MELEVAVAIAAAVAFSAMAQTVTGFGFSLLAVPPLSLVLEPADAVAVALALLVVANVLLVAAEWSGVDRPATAWLLAGALAGLPLGLLSLKAASADQLRLAVAAAIVVAVVVVVTGRPSLSGGWPTLLAAGILTGALTTSLTANGPPTVLALQSRRLAPNAFRPTVGVVLGSSAAIGVVMFAYDGRLGGEVPGAMAVGAPAQLVGWSVGLWVRRFVPADWSRRAVIALLLLGAAVSVTAAMR